MTTEEQQLVERLRAQMAPLKLAADIARPSADGYTYLNDSARALLLQLDQSVHEVAIAYTASEAKVAELQEALNNVATILPRYRLAGKTVGEDEELDAVREQVAEALGVPI